MIEVKPSERPPFKRYVIRNAQGFYYDGHGQAPLTDGRGGYYEAIGEAGVPGFTTRNVLFAVKYGDTESIEQLIKNHKKWCIDRDRSDLFSLFDTCEVVETFT